MYEKHIAEKRREVKEQIQKLIDLSNELQDLIEKNAIAKAREQYWDMTMGETPWKPSAKN